MTRGPAFALIVATVAASLTAARAQTEDTPAPAGPPVADASLNPLHTLDISGLTGFRDRPLFTPSRRRPEPSPEGAPEEEPVVEAAAPEPEAPAPNLKLTGVVIGGEGAVAILQDRDEGATTRLRLGDMVAGWLVTDIGDVVMRLTLGEREEEYRLFDPAARGAPALGAPPSPEEPQDEPQPQQAQPSEPGSLAEPEP